MFLTFNVFKCQMKGTVSIVPFAFLNMTSEFYDNALHFTHYQLVKIGANSSIDKYDIVHDVIASKDFNEEDWKKQIMDAIIKATYSKRVSHFSLDEKIPTKEHITIHCADCNDSYPEDYFISGYDKRKQTFNHRKKCRNCYNKTVRNSNAYKEQRNKAFNKWAEEKYGSLSQFGKIRRKLNKENGIVDATANERNKRFMIKQREQLGDYYIKRLLLDRKKYTKEQITPELIHEKRNQIIERRRKKSRG